MSPSVQPPKMTPKPDAGDVCAPVDDDWVNANKECGADSDCSLVSVRVRCCSERIMAVSKAALEMREDCEPRRQNCTCDPPPVRAEDGRITLLEDRSDVGIACEAGACTSYIEKRACGSGFCERTELCAGYQGLDAGTDVTFQCVANPCSDEELGCECAGSVCTLHPDHPRVCAVELVESSDVSCKLLQR